uniref:Uncharacterized protein n=1 Tax=Panagrolaimus sp. PS1159 TaxID=55785 RepID=A0AC35GR24_9BILA
MPHIWLTNITATQNQQFPVYSIANNKKLFDINGSEASAWQYVGVYTSALSIIIPPSKSFAIHLSDTYQSMFAIVKS